MKIDYSKKFLKDLKKLKKADRLIYKNILEFCFNELPDYKLISDIPNSKKLRNYNDYYRIKIGDYRIGFKRLSKVKETKKHAKIQLLRVLHRKDIYKYFP